MGFVASALVLIGIVLAFIGGITFIIAAFNESVLWGLAVLFLPPASLFFLIVHWRRARDPFFTQLLGYGIILAGSAMGNSWLVTV
jgi:hypothetical protein